MVIKYHFDRNSVTLNGILYTSYFIWKTKKASVDTRAIIVQSERKHKSISTQ